MTCIEEDCEELSPYMSEEDYRHVCEEFGLVECDNGIQNKIYYGIKVTDKRTKAYLGMLGDVNVIIEYEKSKHSCWIWYDFIYSHGKGICNRPGKIANTHDIEKTRKHIKTILRAYKKFLIDSKLDIIEQDF